MKLLSTILAIAIATMTYAQVETPAPSPKTKVEQKVGLTDVTLEYSRPSVKDRAIFAEDGLVVYGEMWRIGANQATKIGFSQDVNINGSALAKGEYAILAVPTAKDWTVNFYPYDSWRWSSYRDQVPTLSVVGDVEKLPYSVESFTIMINNLRDDQATLDFMWAETMVSLDMSLNTEELVMNSIDRVMNGPSGNDYYRAASYYHSSDKDLGQALEWINTATDVDEPKFWQVRRKALILADMNKYMEAITAAEQSLELAKVADNQEYVKMNMKSIAEWSKKK